MSNNAGNYQAIRNPTLPVKILYAWFNDFLMRIEFQRKNSRCWYIYIPTQGWTVAEFKTKRELLDAYNYCVIHSDTKGYVDYDVLYSISRKNRS